MSELDPVGGFMLGEISLSELLKGVWMPGQYGFDGIRYEDALAQADQYIQYGNKGQLLKDALLKMAEQHTQK